MAIKAGSLKPALDSLMALLLVAALSGCAEEDPFQDARNLVLEIIETELTGEPCHPTPIPAEKRRAMAQALTRIDRPGPPHPTGLDPLSLAVLADDVAAIRSVGSVRYRLDDPERNLLHVAAFHNSVRALSFLLDSDVDPNAADPSGLAALMTAAANSRYEAARALVACGDQRMANLLLTSGANVDPEVQALASRNGVDLQQGGRWAWGGSAISESAGGHRVLCSPSASDSWRPVHLAAAPVALPENPRA